MNRRMKLLSLVLMLALLLSACGALSESLKLDDGNDVSNPEQDLVVPEEEVWLAPTVEETGAYEGEAQQIKAPTSHSTMATAISISPDGTYSGTIEERGQKNYYRLDLPESGRLIITANAQIDYVKYALYDEIPNTYFHKIMIWDKTMPMSVMTVYRDLNQGTYYFTVMENSNTFGSYSFTLSFKSANETFAEPMFGADNKMESAHDVAFDTGYTGFISADDEVDYYRFTLPRAGRITFSAITRMKGHINYYIYDEAGKMLWDTWPNADNASGEIKTVETIDLRCGTYYLAAQRYMEVTGTYLFTLSYDNSDETFRDDGSDDVIETANKVNLDTVYFGHLGRNDNLDLYSFTLAKMREVTFVVSAYCESMNLSLLDANGFQLWQDKMTWNSTTKHIVYEKQVILAPGSYYVGLSRNSGNTGNYSLLVKGTVDPQKVVLDKEGTVNLKTGEKLQLTATVSPSTAKTKLSWSSTDEKIVKVDQNGRVTPVKAGEASVVVFTDNGKLDSVKIKVKSVEPEKIQITKGSKATVKVGKKLQLKVKLSPSGAVTTLKWSSSNKNVATVTQKGVVKAKKAGKAKITVKTANGKKATITITVKKK